MYIWFRFSVQWDVMHRSLTKRVFRFAKSTILDIWQASEYTSVLLENPCKRNWIGSIINFVVEVWFSIFRSTLYWIISNEQRTHLSLPTHPHPPPPPLPPPEKKGRVEKGCIRSKWVKIPLLLFQVHLLVMTRLERFMFKLIYLPMLHQGNIRWQ